MKKLAVLAIAFLLFTAARAPLYAQSDTQRNKLRMTIISGGKTIVTELTTVSTSLSRSYDDFALSTTPKDTAKSQASADKSSVFYLSISVKQVSNDLLRVLAKKQSHFDGTITLVDTYGKNPTRTISFKQAGLYSYSDQFSGDSYNDSYGTAAVSLYCKELSINGIVIEQ